MIQKQKYKKVVYRIFISLFIATIALYVLIFSARYSGADYSISDGEYFITWSLLSILAMLGINHFFKK